MKPKYEKERFWQTDLHSKPFIPYVDTHTYSPSQASYQLGEHCLTLDKKSKSDMKLLEIILTEQIYSKMMVKEFDDIVNVHFAPKTGIRRKKKLTGFLDQKREELKNHILHKTIKMDWAIQ